MITFKNFQRLKEEQNQMMPISEALAWHIETETPLNENVYRVGSEKYFDLFREARKLHEMGLLNLTDIDLALVEETDIGEIVEHEGQMVPLDCPMIAEEDDGGDPPIGKPKRGGPKKFYVYVKDGDKVKKISFGDKGGAADGSTLSVKLKDPEARKSYAARHKCDQQKDRTSAAYWSCNLPRYAKALGLSGGGNYYW